MNSTTSKSASIRVLAVDDDPIQREFYQAHLAARFSVTTAASPRAALSILERSEFDIVVTDFDMPEMTGIALLEKLRGSAKTFDLPVILVTATEDLAVVNAAYKLGVATFAAKPVNWTILAAQIEQAVSGRSR